MGNLACPDCNYRTKEHRKLKNHMLIEHDNEEFVDEEFEDSPETPEQQDSIHEQPETETLELNSVETCSVCGGKFATKEDMQYHAERVHEYGEMLTLYFCEECGFPGQDLVALETHRHIEQPDSIREQPDVTPPRKAKRKVLTDLISPKPKKVRRQAAAEHECGVCRKKFSRSDNLKRHMTKAHGYILFC